MKIDKIEMYKTFVGLMLQKGALTENDILPILKKGIPKWIGEKEEKIFKEKKNLNNKK